MNKDFTKHNQALALKELGFDEPCFGYYDTVAVTYLTYPSAINKNSDIENSLSISKQDKNVRCSAPLYQQAFRWFREKYNLYSEINLDSYKEPYSLKVIIKHLDDTNTFVDKEYYPYSNWIGDIDNKKYEEAESACLDKLIEICKTKTNE